MISFCFSPEGQTFRSRASLHAFLLKNGKGHIDINVFNFTASKDKTITKCQILPSQVKQRKKNKKQQETTQARTEILDPPSYKYKKALSSHKGTNEEIAMSRKDADHNKNDIEEITHVLEFARNKTEETVKCCIQATPSAPVDKLQKCPQRFGLLKEKLFRLAPCSNQNTLIVHKDKLGDSQLSVPTVNVEPASESVGEDKDEQARDEIQIHTKGDDKPASAQDADSHRDVAEEVLPDNTGGSCTPVRDSQNS